MKLILDRFEGSLAVCETESGEMIDIEKGYLPKNVKVGDVIIFENNTYTIDQSETEKRRKEIEDLMAELWED
ncbi:DUF3006 domain-containing protein [Bacillus andreraoultii]|uniref:DUF3006 domain-containing protein n=1 Tax=Bacillus andreraoultii TaxID=1499685 RepID=UPI00053B96BE|nr:DUF3006 domain-containing protein [Bacillus andreraoultii]